MQLEVASDHFINFFIDASAKRWQRRQSKILMEASAVTFVSSMLSDKTNESWDKVMYLLH